MKKKILVVDDEKEITRTTKEVLDTEGYKVKTASSTDTAWKKLQKWKTDLILLDIKLPGNIEEFVKKVEQHGDVKILYLSAFSRLNAERKGFFEYSESICGYIEKPFSISKLLSEVKEALKNNS